MTENVKKLLEAVFKNEELREKIGSMDREAIIATAEKLSIELCEEDFAQPVSALSDDEMEQVSAGFIGYDKYTKEEYAKAGITWEHSIFFQDRYYWKGMLIEQRFAEALADYYYNPNDPAAQRRLGIDKPL